MHFDSVCRWALDGNKEKHCWTFLLLTRNTKLQCIESSSAISLHSIANDRQSIIRLFSSDLFNYRQFRFREPCKNVIAFLMKWTRFTFLTNSNGILKDTWWDFNVETGHSWSIKSKKVRGMLELWTMTDVNVCTSQAKSLEVLLQRKIEESQKLD